MKHIITIIVFILILAGIAYGDAYFGNQPLSALHVTLTNPKDGTAQVSAAGAGSASVSIGDTLGQSGAVIIKISKVFVVLKTSEGKTKLPVTRRVVTDGNRIIFQ